MKDIYYNIAIAIVVLLIVILVTTLVLSQLNYVGKEFPTITNLTGF